MVVTREEFRTAEGREQFTKDFEFICGKSDVSWKKQVHNMYQYDWFLKDLNVKEKVELLDQLSNNQQGRLVPLFHWFKKWIDTPAFVTSIDIRPERKLTLDYPTFKPQPEMMEVDEEEDDEEHGEGTSVPKRRRRSTPRKGSKKFCGTEDSPSSRRRSTRLGLSSPSADPPGKAMDGGSSKFSDMSDSRRHKLTYKITIGRYQTFTIRSVKKTGNREDADTNRLPYWDDGKKKERRDRTVPGMKSYEDATEEQVEEFSKSTGKVEYQKSVEDHKKAWLEYRDYDPTLVKSEYLNDYTKKETFKNRGTGQKTEIIETLPFRCYQLWVFEFEETNDGITHMKKYVSKGFTDGYPTESNPEFQTLRDTGIIHETARYILKFFAEHDEMFADELHIDTPSWSKIYDFPKFPHVKKLTIRHYNHLTTQWWLRRCDTKRPIPSVTIQADRNAETFVNEDIPGWRRENPWQNCEAIEYILPVREKELAGIVEVVPYAKHPMFWAQKLTVIPNIVMRLAHLKRMFAIEEFTANMYNQSVYEVNDFLLRWNAGVYHPRLVRVAVDFDMPLNYVHRNKHGLLPHRALEGLDFLEVTEQNSGKLSAELKKVVVQDDTYTFVVYRNWTMPGAEKLCAPSQHPVNIVPHPLLTSTSVPPRVRLADSGVSVGSVGSGGSMGSGSTSPPVLDTEQGVVHLAERKDSVCSGSSGDAHKNSNTPGSRESHTPPIKRVTKQPKWIGGACAVIQFKKAHSYDANEELQSSFHFTAVRNEDIAKELIAFWND